MRGVVALCAMLFGFAPQLRAETLPEFRLDECAWHATHILVVDAAGKVVEVWKGDAKIGDVIPLDQLRLPVEQPVFGKDGFRAADRAPKLKAERLILFLQRDETDKRFSTGWRPARRIALFDISAAWVADGKAYTMQQFSNPGDLMLHEEGTVEKFKTSAMWFAGRRAALDAAKAEPDLAKRAELLKPLATGTGFRGRDEAIEALGACGTAGVPVLRDVLAAKPLKDVDDHEIRVKAIAALARIGKPAQDELLKVLETERAFWTIAAPDLQRGWVRTEYLARLHAERLQAAVGNPAAFDDLPAEKRAVINDLAKLWSESPQLADADGTNRTAELLKAILRRWEK